MNCPVCGLEPLSDQKFCRKCGASLERGTKSLSESAAVTAPERTPVIVREGVTGLVNMTVRTGFLIMFAGAVLGIIGKMLLHVDIVTVVGVLLAVAGIFIVAYPYLLSSPTRKRDTAAPSRPEILTPVESTKKLPKMSDIDFIPSVTEGTTELLKTPTTNSRDG
jgi:hypothetical protein